MTSTILNNKSSFLPNSPTHGQVFVDSEMVQWIYDKYSNVWEKCGVVESIPLASANTNGFLSPSDKNLINSIPAVPGGFGIITDVKMLAATPDNPDGIITGDIKLKSDSLNIACVDSENVVLECENAAPLQCEIFDNVSANLRFSLNDKFIESLIVDLSGPKGKRGLKGSKGEQGEPGFSEGPKGIDGLKGDNIDELCTFNGIRYNDIDGLTDTAIVDLKMVDDDGHGCKLVTTKAKLNLDPDRPADKIVANGLSRSLIFSSTDDDSCGQSRLDDWNISKPPEDTTPLNIQLVRLAKGSNDREDEPIGFNGTMSLQDLIEDIISEYKERLLKLDKQWGKEAKTHIETIDDKARTILNNLADRLTQCEFNLPAVEYCITFQHPDAPLPPPPDPDPDPDPDPPRTPLASAARLADDIHNTSTKLKSVYTQFGQGVRNWRVKQ